MAVKKIQAVFPLYNDYSWQRAGDPWCNIYDSCAIALGFTSGFILSLTHVRNPGCHCGSLPILKCNSPLLAALLDSRVLFMCVPTLTVGWAEARKLDKRVILTSYSVLPADCNAGKCEKLFLLCCCSQ
jgi:hypothetical protein